MTSQHADIAIVGGGIAGLWTLRRAVDAGYNAVLFEAESLGCAQTLASQGMIHGGIKYTLAGSLTGASEAIADMPERWRACLAGCGEIDLSAVTPLSDRYYMFTDGSGLGRLASFFASKALRGRVERLKEPPPAFAGLNGNVYALTDLVLDVQELLEALSAPVAERIFQARLDASNTRSADAGYEITFDSVTLHVDRLVCCAGAGAEALQRALGIDTLPMQRRPLRQVVVHQKLAHPIYAHCVTSVGRPEPRLTITTHGDTLYLGGRLATEGADRDDAEQLRIARSELAECLPWLDFSSAGLQTLYIERAEPRQAGALRPDEAYVAAEGAFIQCWPTKLTLAPDATQRVLEHLPAPRGGPAPRLPLPDAHVGALPWA